MCPFIFLVVLVTLCTAKRDPDFTVDEAITESLRSHGIDPAKYKTDKNGQILAELDMKLTNEQYHDLYVGSGRSKRKAVKGEKWRWTHRTIPYEFEPDHFWPYQIKEMKQAMDVYMQETCLIFRPAHAGDINKVHFQNGIGCNSQLGMVGGTQALNLDWNGCRWMGLYFHEIGHAIGMVHEHQLPDRDNYIGVNWENVEDVMKQWFDKYKEDDLERFGVPYDLASVMHYGIHSFSKEGKQTITTHDKSRESWIGRVYWKMLSFSDVKTVNMMYKCNEWCPNVACPPEGFVDKHCKCITPKSYYDEKCVNANGDDQKCADWAKSGECEANPGWMSINCRKACDRCPKFGIDIPDPVTRPPKPETTTAKPANYCSDKKADCPTDHASCIQYENIMNCQKSCNKCFDECQDERKDCDRWAEDGHCQSNPEAVLRLCPKNLM
ncbi:zinc metalloproteinase nas-1-like [Tubulanus polymorphus]|uniref:zinc metalloproteinase nas-1-like n=1 Tax=Tubulanus polymorphus TaxID=672921 RepID=UPI003DA3A416